MLRSYQLGEADKLLKKKAAEEVEVKDMPKLEDESKHVLGSGHYVDFDSAVERLVRRFVQTKPDLARKATAQDGNDPVPLGYVTSFL